VSPSLRAVGLWDYRHLIVLSHITASLGKIHQSLLITELAVVQYNILIIYAFFNRGLEMRSLLLKQEEEDGPSFVPTNLSKVNVLVRSCDSNFKLFFKITKQARNMVMK